MNKFCWKLSSQDIFDVRSYYKGLHSSSHISFPWKTVQKLNVPTKVSFFLLTAVWERILTTDNLQRQKIVVIDWCCMYKRAGILVIIYSCIAWLLQSYGIWCFHYLGFIGLCQSVVELFDSWPGKFSRHRNVVIWNMTPHCLMWGILQERNAQPYEGNERSIQDLKLYFFQTLFEWTNAMGVFTLISLSDLIDRCAFLSPSFYLVFSCFFSTLPVCLDFCLHMEVLRAHFPFFSFFFFQ